MSPLTELLARCASCREASAEPSVECYQCVRAQALEAPYPCRICDGSRWDDRDDRYDRCLSCHRWGDRRSWDCNYAVIYASEAVHQAIIAFKYSKNLEAGRVLARILEGYLLSNEEEFARFDHIIPAPWYLSNGGAQFDHMARIVEKVERDLDPDPSPLGRVILEKTRGTEHLAGKDGEARAQLSEDIYEAFSVPAHAPNLEGGYVLVVDDLMTSGVTLNAAARRLKSYGAAEVSGLCLLRTVNPIVGDS